MQEENIEVDYYGKPVDELVSYVENKRIKLWVEDKSLRYKAPAGVATKEILKCLSDRKPEVMEYLSTEKSGDLYYSPIKNLEKLEYYPLSASQLRMFMLGLMDSQSTAYNLTQVMKIDGEIDKSKVYEILTQLIDRHESLRTSFEMINGKPVQKIHDRIDFNIEYEEIENVKENIDLLIEEFICPYDLSKPPLLRFKLVKLLGLSDRPSYLLLQDMHHIISDGISEAILVNEVNALFSGKTLPELRIQYKDYASWHSRLLSSRQIQIQKKFWFERLKDELPLLNLPTDYNRPQVFSFKGDSLKFQLERKLSDRINAVARENRVTLFTILLAAYSILLFKYTGQSDMVIGTPTAGRRHADTYSIIGIFVNMLALRILYQPEKPFNVFLKEMGYDIIKAFDNQDYPFEQLVADLNIQRDLSRNPVFDTTFNLLNMDINNIKADGIEISGYEFNKNFAQYDMTLNAIENRNGIQIEINYCTDLFNEETIERLGKHYISILECVAKDTTVRLSDIDMLLHYEKELVLFKFNETAVQYDKEKAIQQLFEEQVERTPDEIALVFGDKHLTYAELNGIANSIAVYLRQKGVKRDSIVGIMVERSFEMIAGILGVLKAGGAYLPIDPQYPKDRVEYMLEDSGAKLLIINESLKDTVQYDGEVLLVEDEGFYASKVSNPDNINAAKDLAYVIYTSGSTGNPKGVMIEHQSVHNFIEGMKRVIDFRQGRRILCLTTLSFDIFVLETLLPLMFGMKIIIADESSQVDPKAISKLIEADQIDMLQVTPSRLLMLSNSKEAYCLKGLKTVMVGGEALAETLLEDVRKLTKARIFNMYGPTETTVWSTVRELTEAKRIDIGKPIANTRIYIVDGHYCMQPLGVTGELCIAGDGLARGYLNRQELTEEKFITNPFRQGETMYCTGDLARWLPNGNIELLGRKDHQVKIRGYRIELGEIENALINYRKIKESVVTLFEDDRGGKSLCAYIATQDDSLDIQEIRDYLGGILPAYMIPSYFVTLETLPLTPNGKVDRKALPEPNKSIESGEEYAAPTNETEEKIAKVWEEILGIEKVGINDNFFRIGGDSIKAIQVASRLNKYGITIEIKDLFNNPTIVGITPYVKCKNAPAEQGTTEKVPLTSGQKRLFGKDFTDSSMNHEMNVCGLEIENVSTKILHNITPFNDIFYKDCLQNAFLNVVAYYNKSMVPFLLNDIITYKSSEDGKGIHLTAQYYHSKSIEHLLDSSGLSVMAKTKSDDIIMDIKKSIMNQKPIIVAVDVFYEKLRKEYQKLHWAHNLLVYGYDDTDEVIHVIEHEEINSLVFQNITISYREIVDAYSGYLNHFYGREDQYTIYEISNISEVGVSDNLFDADSYIKDYLRYFLKNRNFIIKGLEDLEKFVVGFENFYTAGFKEDTTNNILFGMNEIIKSKIVEQYKMMKVFKENKEVLEKINLILKTWNSIRNHLLKSLYRSFFKQDKLAFFINRFNTVLKLEKEYRDIITELAKKSSKILL